MFGMYRNKAESSTSVTRSLKEHCKMQFVCFILSYLLEGEDVWNGEYLGKYVCQELDSISFKGEFPCIDYVLEFFSPSSSKDVQTGQFLHAHIHLLHTKNTVPAIR